MKNLFWKKDPHDHERRQIIARLEREGLHFEQWLITLATGTLVLSVTFLHNSPVEDATRPFLAWSWIALVLSITFGLIDRLLFIFSLSAHPLLSDDGEEEERERRWIAYWSWSERMSWCQIVTFFLGMLLLLLFAIRQYPL